VHINQVEDGVEELHKGQRVSFELGKNPNTGRPQAQRVRLEG